MTADHFIVALIICAAVFYLITRLRAKKRSDCCGNKVTGNRLFK
jgi:hypothetical protein